MKKQLVVFTDLDGTLLDDRYSFHNALPALGLLEEQHIPLVLCTSKTRSEIELCREQLKNEDPFISENGGGIYIPKKAKFKYQTSKFKIEEGKNYFIVKLGADYVDLRRALEEIRSAGFAVKGFGDMSAKEVAELTGLKISDAVLAKERDFDEPFVFKGDKEQIGNLKEEIKRKGYHSTEGEFYHIMGDSDKGRAVTIVRELYVQQCGDVMTAALGDSPNDVEMLKSVDYPIVVRKKDGSYNRNIISEVPECIKADGVGPVGWNIAVQKLLETLLL